MPGRAWRSQTGGDRGVTGGLGYHSQVRICLFTPSFLPALGGAERMADLIVRGLIGRGHQAMVLCQRGAEGPPPPLPYPVRSYRRPPAQHLWPELIALPLLRAWRAWGFEVVLAFYAYPTGYAASLLKRPLGFKLVVTPRGGDLYPNFHALGKPRVLATIRRGYRRADRIISISQWITQRLREVAGDDLPPIDLVHNGLDLAAHDAALEAARENPPPFEGFDPDAPRPATPFLLHLARVTAVKQQRLALEAIQQARAALERRRMSYLFVGDGPLRPELELRAAELGLGRVVRFLGQRTGAEKAWLLGHATALVSASREEGLPNVLIEAMASGLPVLASDIGPHRELLDPPRDGWGLLFKAGDAADLARQLERLASSDLAALRRRALALRGGFSLEAMIRGYEQACQAALEA